MIPDEFKFIPSITRVPVQQSGDHDKRILRADLSEDQEVALDQILELSSRATQGVVQKTKIFRKRTPVYTLGGYAGTGKSTLIPIIADELRDVSHTAFCSLTGKAANVLQRKLTAAGIRNPGYVGTIHRLIYKPLTDEHKRVIGWQRRSRPLIIQDDLDDFYPIHRIIVDEASMVGKRILQDLLEYELPILAVGDHNQLPPVQDESVIAVPDVRLEKIHRQAENNPIIRLSTLIREQGDIPRDFKPTPEVAFCKTDDAYAIIGETYERLGLNMAVIVRRNVVRKELNTAPREDPEPTIGDLVICLKNSPPVYNGMRGIIQAISPCEDHWYRAEVLFPDDGLKLEGLLNRYQFGRDHTIESTMDLKHDVPRFPLGANLGLLFDFGMALTAHKSQGSGFDEVVLIPEKWSSDSFEDYQRWIYTAVTRAAKKITIVR